MPEKRADAELKRRIDKLEHRVDTLEKKLSEIKVGRADTQTKGLKPLVDTAPDLEMKKRILVIEDSKADQMILEEILKQAGYDVLLASDGKEGLEKFYADSPDLVITDMVMPEKMGSEVISEIKGKHPQQKIIAMSSGSHAYGREIELDLAAMFGAHTIAKPFEPVKVLEIIHNLLQEETEAKETESEAPMGKSDTENTPSRSKVGKDLPE